MERKTRLWSLIGLVAALVAAFAVAGCGGDDSTDGTSGDGTSAAADLPLITPGTLTVGSDIPYPPFDVMDGATFTGFDGDLVTEIADGLGLELEVRDSGFDGLQSGLSLNSNQCDLVASAMTL